MICLFEGCDRKAVSKTFGLCGTHRMQVHRGKDLTPIISRIPQPKLDGESEKEYKNRLARKRHSERMATDPIYAAKKIESSRKWRTENPELMKEFVRAWAKNVDRSRYNLAWSQNNKDKRRETGHKRRALQRGVEAEFIDHSLVWLDDEGICGICHEPADIENWHLDHIIPLSRGGPHIRSNVQVSHPRCNLSKGDLLMSEFYAREEVRMK